MDYRDKLLFGCIFPFPVDTNTHVPEPIAPTIDPLCLPGVLSGIPGARDARAFDGQGRALRTVCAFRRPVRTRHCPALLGRVVDRPRPVPDDADPTLAALQGGVLLSSSGRPGRSGRTRDRTRRALALPGCPPLDPARSILSHRARRRGLAASRSRPVGVSSTPTH